MQPNLLHRLMQGLYYPAALGTALVLFVYHIARASGVREVFMDVRTWLALFLLFYFSLSYLSNERWSQNYRWPMFLSDMIEVVLVLLAYYFLGLADINVHLADLRPFYACLLFVPFLHIGWNLVVGVRNWRLSIISGLRIVTLGTAIAVNNITALVPWFVLVALTALTTWYASLTLRKAYNPAATNSVSRGDS